MERAMILWQTVTVGLVTLRYTTRQFARTTGQRAFRLCSAAPTMTINEREKINYVIRSQMCQNLMKHTLSRVLACQSAVSILQIPPMSSSSSRSSNGRSRFEAISSWKPFCSERNCCSMPRMKRYDTYNLKEKTGNEIDHPRCVPMTWPQIQKPDVSRACLCWTVNTNTTKATYDLKHRPKQHKLLTTIRQKKKLNSYW